VSEHPGAPHGLDTIVGRGECLQISISFVGFTVDSKASPPPGISNDDDDDDNDNGNQ
jgi:hypothetical protein